jgi:hypothetical protein
VNKRKVLRVKEIVEVIQEIENVIKKADVWQEFDFVNYTIQMIWKNRTKIISAFKQNRSRIALLQKLNEVMFSPHGNFISTKGQCHWELRWHQSWSCCLWWLCAFIWMGAKKWFWCSGTLWLWHICNSTRWHCYDRGTIIRKYCQRSMK